MTDEPGSVERDLAEVALQQQQPRDPISDLVQLARNQHRLIRVTSFAPGVLTSVVLAMYVIGPVWWLLAVAGCLLIVAVWCNTLLERVNHQVLLVALRYTPQPDTRPEP